MKSGSHFLMLLVASSTFAGCVSPFESFPQAKLFQSKLDPLALQQMQTQEFETSKKILFASVISVFQDSGFIIEAGDLETGLITAKSPTSVADATQFALRMLSTGATVEARATAFVEEARLGFSTVRLNFIERRQERDLKTGGSAHDIPNEDPAYYEKIFNKIREAVFLREAYKATPAAK